MHVLRIPVSFEMPLTRVNNVQSQQIWTPSKILSLFLFIWYLAVFSYCLFKRELARKMEQNESVKSINRFCLRNQTKTILVWNGVRRKFEYLDKEIKFFSNKIVPSIDARSSPIERNVRSKVTTPLSSSFTTN